MAAPTVPPRSQSFQLNQWAPDIDVETKALENKNGPTYRIGSGPWDYPAAPPSPEWFRHFVTPSNFLDYWNDVDGRYGAILAAHWLAAGFDSTELRWLAGLDESDADAVTTEQIITVLRLLDVAVELPAEFLARCGRAIAQIQVDLDATGFAQFQMQPANAMVGHDALPGVRPALPGGGWDASQPPMTQDMDDVTLTYLAAESVSDTLVYLEHVFWPTCVQHAGPPITLVELPPDSIPGWHCARGSHVVAPLGKLAACDIRPPD